MRRLVAGFIALAAASLPPLQAEAQGWPQRAVRLVVPFPPGGPSDTVARILAQRLQETTGQTFVVENRPGSSGNIGAEVVARSEPDGSVIMIGGPNNFTTNQFLFKSLNFNIERDLAGISIITDSDNAVLVPKDSPIRSIQELVDLSRSRPGTFNCGSTGVATMSHLTLELFRQTTGADVQHVPFRGSAPIVTELLASRVTCAFDNLPVHLPNIRTGAVRVLAVTSERRIPELPDVPTMTEAGVQGLVVTTWFALAAPARTPHALLEQMSQQVNRALLEPDVKEKLATIGFKALGTTPAEAARIFANDARRWSEVIQKANITIN